MGDEEAVSAAAWAIQPNRSGMLTLAVGDALKTYDTSASGSRPVLVGFRHSQGDIQSMAFVPTMSRQGESNATDSDFYPHRMLAVPDDGDIQDIPTFQAAPLDISRDGRIGFCLGQNAWIGAEGDGKHKDDCDVFVLSFVCILSYLLLSPLQFDLKCLRQWTPQVKEVLEKIYRQQ